MSGEGGKSRKKRRRWKNQSAPKKSGKFFKTRKTRHEASVCLGPRHDLSCGKSHHVGLAPSTPVPRSRAVLWCVASNNCRPWELCKVPAVMIFTRKYTSQEERRKRLSPNVPGTTGSDTKSVDILGRKKKKSFLVILLLLLSCYCYLVIDLKVAEGRNNAG